jgi:hypothetical protein
VHAQHHDRQVRLLRQQVADQHQAVAVGQREVHDHDIARALQHPLGHLARIAELGRDLPARLHFEQLPEASPYDGMIVDEHDVKGGHGT